MTQLISSTLKEPNVLPTYPIGGEEKNPLFLEKRVYQGSSGVVYVNHIDSHMIGRKFLHNLIK